MSNLIAIHLTNGKVVYCDETCHDSVDQEQTCICYNRFQGLGLERAKNDLPLAIGHIVKGLIADVPNLASIVINVQEVPDRDHPELLWLETLRTLRNRRMFHCGPRGDQSVRSGRILDPRTPDCRSCED